MILKSLKTLFPEQEYKNFHRNLAFNFLSTVAFYSYFFITLFLNCLFSSHAK